MIAIDEYKLRSELKFRTSRSSGPGGQSVNKLSTKVELLFDVWNSKVLSEEQKETLSEKLKNRINSDGILQLSSEETRSQLKNKEFVIERFFQLLNKALKPEKKRIPVKPSKASKEKRLKSKKIKSVLKDSRRQPEI
jgi:ribosome-associated protein